MSMSSLRSRSGGISMLLLPTQASQLLRIEDLEQLGLSLDIDLGDFVEKECAVVGEFDQTHLLGLGIRKGSGLVTEKLALEEVRGQRSTVDFDKGAVCVVALFVDRLCKETLARTRFSEQQDRRAGALADALDQG
jgi:hypothetical protein